MKNLIKSFMAITLIVSLVLSFCSCSIKNKAIDSSAGEPNSFFDSIFNGTSKHKDENFEETIIYQEDNTKKTDKTLSVQKSYKEKIDEIVNALVVGETYSELPLYPAKVGITEFSWKDYSRIDNQRYPDGIYIDINDPSSVIFYSEFAFSDDIQKIWIISDNNKVKNIYLVQGDKYYRAEVDDAGDFAPLLDYEYPDIYDTYISKLAIFSGYDYSEFKGEFTFKGITQIEGYENVLLFETTEEIFNGIEHVETTVSYYVDAETSFLVKIDNGFSVSRLLKDIEINPEQTIPDFENNLTDYME